MSSLQRIHFVHRRSIPGEGKKAYFEAETDWWYVAQELLDQEVMREIRIMSRALDDAAETFENANSEKAARDLEKIRKLQRLYSRCEQLVDLFAGLPIDRLVSLLKQVRTGNTDSHE